MAQPSLSEQIRRLEAELGVALFARAGRGLELTEAGRLLRPHAERTLGGRAGGGESVREVRELTGGTARSARSARAPLPARRTSCRTSARATRTSASRVVGQNSAEVADAVREASSRPA
jgi:hypothetical protein